MEYYSAIKKNENFAICISEDGLGGHYTILYHIYVGPKKYNKLVCG